MEIILNCGDKINVPEGCKAEIKDGVITIDKEKIRWRAEKDEDFYFVGIFGEVITRRGWDEDGKLWKAYNYFRTEEDARKAAELVKATLKKFHEENSQDEKDNVQR